MNEKKRPKIYYNFKISTVIYITLGQNKAKRKIHFAIIIPSTLCVIVFFPPERNHMTLMMYDMKI